jgi:hypothetical protein
MKTSESPLLKNLSIADQWAPGAAGYATYICRKMDNPFNILECNVLFETVTAGGVAFQWELLLTQNSSFVYGDATHESSEHVQRGAGITYTIQLPQNVPINMNMGVKESNFDKGTYIALGVYAGAAATIYLNASISYEVLEKDF